MPSVDDRGVGECRHKFEDGRCWFCGEPETAKEEDDDSMAPMVEMLKKLSKGETFEASMDAMRSKLAEQMSLSSKKQTRDNREADDGKKDDS